MFIFVFTNFYCWTDLSFTIMKNSRVIRESTYCVLCLGQYQFHEVFTYNK